jgi:hypothetical protein
MVASAPMARSVSVACIAGVLAALALTSGCNGERIKLGNGALVDGAACPHAQVNANQVLWIGDSWVLVPGNQHTEVRDLARKANAIGPSDDYTIGAAAAATIAQTAGQYTSQESNGTKVKVLIMDGGTWDTLTANGSAASVSNVASAFNQFLATVASDGTVDQIVYYLMPELASIPGVAALRPLLRQSCAQSSVPCHFLDLQQLWAGHPEYTASDGLLPSDAGGTVIADAIWAIMQANCIAQ